MLGATAEIERANFIQKSGGTAVWRGSIRQLGIAEFGFRRPSLHVERDEFDDILLRAAERRGVKVFEEVGVRTVELEGPARAVTYVDRRGGVQAAGRIECRYIVDGS